MANLSNRPQLVDLLERVPETDLPTVVAFLEFLIARAAAATLVDTAPPVDEAPRPERLQTAPVDDEALSAEDAAALDEAYAALARGDTLTDAEMRRALGLPHR